MADERPLSALLSQVLVAFAVEFDNAFERRMSEAGCPGANLSWSLWADLMRFAADGAITVRDLTVNAKATIEQVRFQLGCVERWGFVTLGERGSVGWGSGRGIRADWHIRLTTKGLQAVETWQPLAEFIERRWERRFGREEIDELRAHLRKFGDSVDLSLPGLLWQCLVAYRAEFDRDSDLPLPFCANTIRVLNEKPTSLSEIARLTGSSPETSGIGWQMRPYVIVEAAPGAARGKVARLSPRGLRAQKTYRRLTEEIDARWAADELRAALLELFVSEGGHGLLLREGLIAPAGTVRAGERIPALGRLFEGPAMRQRMRELVAQTRVFVEDPAAALPHYPLWDMNRGFGP